MHTLSLLREGRMDTAAMHPVPPYCGKGGWTQQLCIPPLLSAVREGGHGYTEYALLYEMRVLKSFMCITLPDTQELRIRHLFNIG